MLSAFRRALLSPSRASPVAAQQLRGLMYMSESRLGVAEEHGPSYNEFDTDAGDHVPKEVSVHDRRQSQLSAREKRAAVLADFDGREADYDDSSEDAEPAARPEREDIDVSDHTAAAQPTSQPNKMSALQKQSNQALMEAENKRD